MSSKPQVARRPDAPTLRVIDGARAPRKKGREVVAEILSDGTIRLVGGADQHDDRRFAVGQLAGDGWTLWWDRRRW